MGNQSGKIETDKELLKKARLDKMKLASSREKRRWIKIQLTDEQAQKAMRIAAERQIYSGLGAVIRHLIEEYKLGQNVDNKAEEKSKQE